MCRLEASQVGVAVTQAESAGKWTARNVGSLDIGLSRRSVSDGAPADLRKHPCTLRIVQADNHRSVKWHLVDELEKGGADGVQIGVVIQVFAVHVGDHRDDRRQLEEGAIAFVGFHYQEIAMPNARVGAAHRADAPAYHHRRVKTRVVKNGRGHRRGGGLAVAARHRDTVLEAHELRQQLAARITGIEIRRASCTSGFCSSTAELTTSARAPSIFDAAWPSKTRAPMAASRSVIGESFTSLPEIW